MTPRVVVVGSFNADQTAYVKRVPGAGETVLGLSFATTPGGKGSNQAIAARRLGAEVTFVGRVGRDVFGQLAENLWKQEGIDARFVVEDAEHPTGVAVILVDEAGENRIVVVPGANLALSTADVDAAAAAIADANALVVQLEIERDVVLHALRVARKHRVTTILNPAPATVLASDLLELADYITPNQTELAVLTGLPNAIPAGAAPSLIARDGQTVVVTLGADGAQYVRRRGTALIPGYPVEVVETTGAGDAFNGALAVAIAEGQPLEAAIRFANAAGAVSVSRRGAASSMPYRTEVESFLVVGFRPHCAPERRSSQATDSLAKGR